MGKYREYSIFKGLVKTTGNQSILIGILLFACLIFACTNSYAKKEDPGNKNVQIQKENDPCEKWGLKPVSIRVTAAGHFIDFRYSVTQPVKAATLMSGKLKSYLIHQNTGKVLPVPTTKLGPLRAKAVKPKKDRLYSIMFNNSPIVVKKGDKVTVAIGEFRAKDLIVE